MSELNIYASRIFSEHPLAIWPLDEFAVDDNSGDPRTFSSQYTTSNPEASAIIGPNTTDNMALGVPLCYGSNGSLKLFYEDTSVIGQKEYRLWKNVKVSNQTGLEVNWEFWKDEVADYKELMVEDTIAIPISTAAIEYPSYGLFDENGKYNTYTAEMWIRIDSRSNYAQKIWGSIDSFDGLWVADNYIILNVGGQWASHSIEYWGRPMLVAVTYEPTKARLVINGQEVISLELDPKATDFSSQVITRTDSATLGFMCPDNALIYEVDNFSIFPYVVPDLVLKRRFVWGQGVENIAEVSTAYQTTSAYLDYPFAEYTNNVIFPDLWTWETGYLDGFVSTGRTIRTPAYELPEVYAKGRDLDALYLENHFNNSAQGEQTPFFSFKPEYDWDQPSYFFFNNIEKLTETPQAIVGVFRDGNDAPLMVFKKKWSTDEVRIRLESDQIIYSINGQDKEFKDVSDMMNDSKIYTVGFDLNKIVHSDSPFRNFFSTLSDIEMFVGGDGITTFEGRIYRVGISDTSNMARQGFAASFDEKGIPNNEASTRYLNNYATYTLRPFMHFDKFWLDVSANAYWEGAVPLEVLAKNIKNDEGLYERKLNSFQINYGYDGEYEIENDVFTFPGAELRAYLSFQSSIEITKPLRDFSSVVPLPKNRVIDATDYENKLFDIVNGCVVNPPQASGLQATIYFVANPKSVIKSPFIIKSLSLSSLADLTDEVEIGSRYGVRLRSSSNFAITKESVPYLYLSKDSGVEPLDGPVYIPINEQKEVDYNMGLFNVFLKPNFKNMGAGSHVLFTINYNNDASIDFAGDPETGMFNLVYNGNDKSEHTKLYKNGNCAYELDSDGRVIDAKDVLLFDNQWAHIGLEFPKVLGMSLGGSSIVFNPGAVFQNAMSARVSGNQIAASVILRTWGEVKAGGTWGEWETKAANYEELMTEGQYLTFPVDPTDMFNIFTGHNSIVFDSIDKTNFIGSRAKTYSSIVWNTYDRRPA